MFQKAYTPAKTFFGRRKCFAGLQELFADVTKGMHACGNFFRAAKMFRRSAGTFCGRRKRHACLRKLFSDGENVSQVCRNFLRTSQKACMPAETSFGTFQGPPSDLTMIGVHLRSCSRREPTDGKPRHMLNLGHLGAAASSCTRERS